VPLPGTSALVRGLLPEDPFLETYLVRPGGATVLELGPDERVTVVDPDGGQVAELTVLGPDGRAIESFTDEQVDAFRRDG
jgi:hypothetical protein